MFLDTTYVKIEQAFGLQLVTSGEYQQTQNGNICLIPLEGIHKIVMKFEIIVLVTMNFIWVT